METDEDQSDKKFEKSIHRGRGKRVEVMIAALVLVAALIVVVFVAFRGRQISRSAAAMAEPDAGTPKAGSPSTQTP